MIYDEANSEIVLSTGKRMYAHWGVSGCNKDEFGHWQVTYGCDGAIATHALTPAEAVEIAEHQIAEWEQFKNDYLAMTEQTNAR